MLMEIIKYLNTPYKYGGNTKDGIDCSAFTQILYRDVFHVGLERSARLQYNQGSVVSSGDQLRFGDLVFFNTRKRVKPGHVGIYIGDDLFAHASSAKGVTISSIDYDYYARTFMGARRFETNGLTEKTQ
jgi:cell wall-associated NlpC family hydrolase